MSPLPAGGDLGVSPLPNIEHSSYTVKQPKLPTPHVQPISPIKSQNATKPNRSSILYSLPITPYMSSKQLNSDLDLLMDEEGFDDFREKIVKVFQPAFAALLDDSASTTLEQQAEGAASGLQALIPNPKPDELGWFEDIWHALILIATRVPHTDDQSQSLLVKALQVLRESDSSLWKDLAQFGEILRDHWVGTCPSFLPIFVHKRSPNRKKKKNRPDIRVAPRRRMSKAPAMAEPELVCRTSSRKRRLHEQQLPPLATGAGSGG